MVDEKKYIKMKRVVIALSVLAALQVSLIAYILIALRVFFTYWGA